MIQSIILILISLAILIITVKTLLNIRKIRRDGIEVEGIIFDKEKSGGTENITYPIVRFLSLENTWITQTSKTGVIPSLYKKGEKVIIVYQDGNPNNFFIKDKLTYLIPIILFAIAIVLLGIALVQLSHI